MKITILSIGIIYDFISQHFYDLKFSRPVKDKSKMDRRVNPKRMQRQIKRQLKNTGVGTKAQQALKLEHESRKVERKVRSKEEKEKNGKRKISNKIEKEEREEKGTLIIIRCV